MKFRGHETFFLRKGWLNKGLKNVDKDPFVFMGTNGNPMDILGIGSNMVKSLRYWLQAFMLTSEPKSGRRMQTFTDLGELIFKNDPYTEEIGTLCLLHYTLASNLDLATAWFFLFNEFKLTEFTRDDFVLHISNYLRLQDIQVSSRSLEDDFNCIINTYISRSKSNPKKVSAESNIDCPLGEMGLIDFANKKKKIYKRRKIKSDSLPLLIALAIIMDQANGSNEIKIASIQNDTKSIGKIFNLDIIALTGLLYKLELYGYIKVIRTAGLDVIKIISEMTFIQCVDEYYNSLNN